MIVRIKRDREKPYVVLDIAALRCKRLSLKARGLWALCMSFPDDWVIRPRHLVTLSERDGIKAVRNALGELRVNGLATYDQPRHDDGTLGAGEWTIYEKPRLQRFEPDTLNGNPAERADMPDSSKRQAATDAGAPDTPKGAPVNRNKTPESPHRHAVGRHADEGPLRSNEATKSLKDEVCNKQQARPRGRRYPVPAAPDNSVHSNFVTELVARGVDPGMATSLLEGKDPSWIMGLLKRGLREALTPGWYVDALKKEYRIRPLRGIPMRCSYAQARQMITKQGITLSQTNAFKLYFDTVKEKGSTYYRPTEKMQRRLGIDRIDRGS